jgi:hypothetical protein
MFQEFLMPPIAIGINAYENSADGHLLPIMSSLITLFESSGIIMCL